MHFLITAGGTREYIDPVRFITNASSGRIGYALAGAAIGAGHKVTLISTPVAQRLPKGLKAVKVETAAEMFEAVRKHFGRCDCLIMAAAVSDYTCSNPSSTKIRKSVRPLTIKLKPTVDILKWAGEQKKVKRQKVKGKKQKRQLVVGFALEDRKLRERAEQKLMAKNLDMIIANKPAAIGAEKSTVEIKERDRSWFKIKNTSKAVTAKKIVRMVEELVKIG